jgi:phosphate transport system substrate-binding protein
MRKLTYLEFFAVTIILSTFLFTGCKSFREQQDELPDTKDRGTIHVSADESFKPIIDEHVMVYHSQHPKTRILVDYKAEADCLKDMLNDSVRLLIVTRTFTQDESDAIVDSLKKGPKGMTLAYDAITVLVNPKDEDSLFTMADIKAILAGRFNKNLIPVFDGGKATSTVRFAIDSVLRGEPLTKNAMAAKSSLGVIDYVATHTGVIGFIGVSWIGNPEDTASLRYLKEVRVASLEHTRKPGVFVKASQLNIGYRWYPMVRDLNYILKENYKGLGTGFADFMSGELGQLIFKRAYLVPAQKDFTLRPVRLKE